MGNSFRVLGVSPADGAEVRFDAVEVTFSEPIDPATVDSGSFLMVDSQGGAVASVVEAEGAMARLVPDAPVAAGMSYRIRLTSAVRAAADGRPLAAHEWEVRVPAELFDLAVGRSWIYAMDKVSTVFVAGRSDYEFHGRVLLVAESESGGTYTCGVYEIRDNRDVSHADLEYRTVQLREDQSGVYLRGRSRNWHAIVSKTAQQIDDPDLLLVGATIRDQAATQSVVQVGTPLGSRAGIRVHARFSNLDPSFPPNVEIVDEREAVYAQGIGLVSGSWDLFQDDNDPRGTDIFSEGGVRLTDMPGDVRSVLEQEPNEARLDDANPVSGHCVVRGRIGPNDDIQWFGSSRVHDLFVLEVDGPSTLDVRVSGTDDLMYWVVGKLQPNGGLSGWSAQRLLPEDVDAGRYFLMACSSRPPTAPWDYQLYVRVIPQT